VTAGHDPQLDPTDVTVVVAMGVEARPVRRRAPGLRVVLAGIGLSSLERAQLSTGVVLSVGLAGGLAPELASGTVVIPSQVAREDGELIECDPAWSAALATASRRLGFPTVTLPLLSADGVVTGSSRAKWAARGFAAVDMETALLAAMVGRVAAVRVVIDTPSREISSAWERPGRAALDPRNWLQGVWLARTAPRLSTRAARVVAAAIQLDAA
jgi:adenosylhomocysteine nucleosidase